MSLHMLQVLTDKDPGLTGNLLVERLVGAHIHLVSIEEFIKIGSLVIAMKAFHLYFSRKKLH